MPDYRSKVAFERAALLVQAEADLHTHEHIFACEYCGGSWITEGDYSGCMTRRTLLALIDQIRKKKVEI